jgi:PAS domain S-box-containing protein
MVLGDGYQGVGGVAAVNHSRLSKPFPSRGSGISVVGGVVRSLSLLTIFCHFLLVLAAVEAATEVNQPRDIIAVVPAYFPPQYSTDSSGRPAGFAIDVLEAVAARASLRVTYRVEHEFKDVLKSLRTGTADLMPNIGITPNRREFMAFTQPVQTFPISVFVRADNSDITGPADLAGHTMGAVKGSFALRRLSGRKDIKILIFRNMGECMVALLAGRVDFLVYPGPVMNKAARDAGVHDRIRTAGPPLAEIKRGMGVRLGDPALLKRLNTAIGTFVAAPEYRKIHDRWYGPPAPFWTGIRLMWAAAAVVLVLVIAMAAWRHLSVVRLNRRLIALSAEREQAEQGRRDSDERFRVAFEAGSVGMFMTDEEGCVIQVNRAFRELLGYSEPEMLGRNSIYFTFPEDFDGAAKRRRTLLADGAPYTVEKRFQHRNGEPRWALCNISTVKNVDGSLRHIIGNVQDIAARKQAQEALQESEYPCWPVRRWSPCLNSSATRSRNRTMRCSKSCPRWAPSLAVSPSASVPRRRIVKTKTGCARSSIWCRTASSSRIAPAITCWPTGRRPPPTACRRRN